MHALESVWADSLDLEEAFGHDEVDSACIDEMSSKPCRDLSERFDKGADGDGANRGSNRNGLNPEA